jgi:hypothetical protein
MEMRASVMVADETPPRLPLHPSHHHTGGNEMTLRERCEALVREWRGDASDLRQLRSGANGARELDERADELQAALDATADEGRDAERLDWIQASEPNVFKTMSSDEWAVGLDSGTTHFSQSLRTAIDAAMKESKP